MKEDDLNLIAQLIESSNIAAGELKKAVEKKNADMIRKSKEEILKFQKEILKIIEQDGD